jgi:hypothetical protein
VDFIQQWRNLLYLIYNHPVRKTTRDHFLKPVRLGTQSGENRCLEKIVVPLSSFQKEALNRI